MGRCSNCLFGGDRACVGLGRAWYVPFFGGDFKMEHTWLAYSIPILVGAVEVMKCPPILLWTPPKQIPSEGSLNTFSSSPGAISERISASSVAWCTMMWRWSIFWKRAVVTAFVKLGSICWKRTGWEISFEAGRLLRKECNAVVDKVEANSLGKYGWFRHRGTSWLGSRCWWVGLVLFKLEADYIR